MGAPFDFLSELGRDAGEGGGGSKTEGRSKPMSDDRSLRDQEREEKERKEN